MLHDRCTDGLRQGRFLAGYADRIAWAFHARVETRSTEIEAPSNDFGLYAIFKV
jgi:hypothetical protein